MDQDKKRHLISQQNRRVIFRYLTHVLETAQEALARMYPNRTMVINDGRHRLYLLYIPYQRTNPKTRQKIGRPIPVPIGDELHEWNYIEGEIAGLPWEDIIEHESCVSFPKRTPPFPARKYLHELSRTKKYKQYPRIKIKAFPSIGLFDYDMAIAKASWLLYINDIPFDLWNDVIITLMEHDVRLKLLSKTINEIKDVRAIRDGMLPRKDAITFFESLIHVLPFVGTDNGYKLQRYAKSILEAIRFDPLFKDQQLESHFDRLERKLEGRMKKLNTSTRFYDKDSTRLLKPAIVDLMKILNEGLLQKIVSNDKCIDQDPWWLQAEPVERTSHGMRPNGNHLYRLVGDFMRFFYDWTTIAIMSSLEPPDWRGDRGWYQFNDGDEERPARVGEMWRMKFGKRMQSIHKGKLRKTVHK